MFAVYDVDLPTKFAGSDLSQFPQDDTIPSNIDPSTISYMSEFLPLPLETSCLTRVLQ